MSEPDSNSAPGDETPESEHSPGDRSRRVRDRWWAATLAMGVVAAGLGLYAILAAPQAVEVAPARRGVAAEVVRVAGMVRGERSTDLAVAVAGVVRAVSAKPGGSVRKGAILLSLDESQLDAAVAAARDAVDVARAELASARQRPTPAQVRQARAELQLAESEGRMRVSQAEARLKGLQAAPKTEEVTEAESELQARRSALSSAQAEYQRLQQLAREGAAARSEADAARAAVDVARANVTAQEQRLNQLRGGAGPDELAEAQSAVAEAQASRTAAVAAAREKLRSLETPPAPEMAAAAQARLAEARAQLRRAQEARAGSDLRAPLDGVVSAVLVKPGQNVSPGQALVVLDDPSKAVVEAQVNADVLAGLSIGLKAVVTPEGRMGPSVDAVLYDLGSPATQEEGATSIRFRLESRAAWLRPGTRVQLRMTTGISADRIEVPVDAVVSTDGSSCVLAVRNGRAVRVPVTVTSIEGSSAAVRGGIREGEPVVRNASQVTPGARVRIVRIAAG